MQNLLDIKLNRKGFTLVELLIAMAIIAVLIAIAAYGIQILQRNARNTRRRKVVQDIQLTVSDIQANFFEYPSTGVAGISSPGATGGPILFNTPNGIVASDEGTYQVRGFNAVTVTAGTGCAGTAETVQNRIQLFWDLPSLTVATRLEGTIACFAVNV
jgi:prepilin-type N-terminal cleavage/methylation domain-containing protein